MEQVSDVVHPGATRGVRLFAWTTLVIIVGTMVAIIIAFFLGTDEPLGEPGQLDEPDVERPPDLVVPDVIDTTRAWGLDAWLTVGSDPLRGGVSLADLDADLDLDLVVAGGSLGVYEWVGDRFEPGVPQTVGDAVSVHVGDVDGDGAADLLVGRSDGASIVWGGNLFEERAADVTDLGVTGVVTGAVPVELGSGPEVLVLGYGGRDAAPDVLIPMDGRTPGPLLELPDSRRKSMVAAVADIDGDDLADLWIGHDVGWATGGDSIYSRRGEDEVWVDIAADLGANLEIDAMGLTLADLDGDDRLDAYLSDLGDNEFLVRGDAGFEKVIDVGAGRIRGAADADNEISSSWGSGAADWNLDGRPDLVVVNGGFSDISVRNKVVNTFIVGDDPPSILLRTADGTYVDAWPFQNLEWTGRSRGLSLGDIDGDGDVDAVVVDHEGGLHALRNDIDHAAQTWLAPSGCLVAGDQVRIEGSNGSWTTLTHQLSFLGAHAPQVVIPVDAAATPRCG